MIGDELLDHSRNPYHVTRESVDVIILDVLIEVERATHFAEESLLDLHLPGSDLSQRDRLAALHRWLRQADTNLRGFGIAALT